MILHVDPLVISLAYALGTTARRGREFMVPLSQGPRRNVLVGVSPKNGTITHAVLIDQDGRRYDITVDLADVHRGDVVELEISTRVSA